MNYNYISKEELIEKLIDLFVAANPKEIKEAIKEAQKEFRQLLKKFK